MKLFTWLKNKAGKMPISLAQAAGLTAVVGAAGFAAMSYLSSPDDTNTSFLPPSAYEQQGDVVYVSQGGGGGQYTTNGDVTSSFHAKASDSIRLANRQFERQQQADALADADVKPSYASNEADPSVQLPKAYQMGDGELGLGMGTTADKQGTGALDMLSNLQKEIPGLEGALSNAQAAAAAANQGGAQAGTSPAGAAGAGASGQTAAQLANAPRNWGQGGTVRAGSGGSIDNSFAIQDSGKNTPKGASAAMAQAGNAFAEAQAVMGQLKEGSRMRGGSRANFGRSDGLGEDRDARGQGWRRNYGNARSELAMIRKQSGKIAANATNSANEGGRPFLSSAKISGGLMVDGGQVTTGMGSTSSDLGATDRAMRGIKGWAAGVQSDFEERTKKRHEMRKWMWWAFPVALVAIPLIARARLLARIYKASIFTYALGVVMDIVAIVALIAALFPVAKLLLSSIQYLTQYGGDGSSIFATSLGGILAAGLAASFFIPAIGKALAGVTNWVLMTGGAVIGLGGATAFKFLSEKGDGYTDEELDDNKAKSALDEEPETDNETGNTGGRR